MDSELTFGIPNIELPWSRGGTVNPGCFAGHPLVVLFLPADAAQQAAELAAYEELAPEFTTSSGIKLDIRPASPDDELLLIDFFRKLTPDDLRFRFLSSMKEVGPSLAHQLVDVDHVRTEDLLAFDERDGSLVATAMIAADPDLQHAEVAIAVRSDRKGEGIAHRRGQGSRVTPISDKHQVESRQRPECQRL